MVSSPSSTVPISGVYSAADPRTRSNGPAGSATPNGPFMMVTDDSTRRRFAHADRNAAYRDDRVETVIRAPFRTIRNGRSGVPSTMKTEQSWSVEGSRLISARYPRASSIAGAAFRAMSSSAVPGLSGRRCGVARCWRIRSVHAAAHSR